MSKYWLDYVKHCYDLVIESESLSAITLEHDVEAHVVHLMARNFERTDVGNTAVAIMMLQAVNSGTRDNLVNGTSTCTRASCTASSTPVLKGRWGRLALRGAMIAERLFERSIKGLLHQLRMKC